jgi:hypothetical protein
MGDQESEKLEVGTYATSLHQAVKENDIRSIRSLVEGGAKVQAPDKIGRTPLHWALVFGHEEAARVPPREHWMQEMGLDALLSTMVLQLDERKSREFL